MNDFAKFKKIDAHSHIGHFGSPFNVDFNAEMLLGQMTEYNIEKTILCPAACTLNEELNDAFTADSPMVDPIMEIAKKYDKPVFIHCGHPPFSLPWQIGLLAERHPQVQVVMIHMGHGHGVYIDGSITMAKKFDNLMLECSGMPMGCQIKNAYETVGGERVMFGIDSPFHHPTVEIQRVLSCGLNDSQLEDVFYNNAAKFMGIAKL